MVKQNIWQWLTMLLVLTVMFSCTYYRASKFDLEPKQPLSDWLMTNTNSSILTNGNNVTDAQKNNQLEVDRTLELIQTCQVTQKNLLTAYHEAYICLSPQRKENLQNHQDKLAD